MDRSELEKRLLDCAANLAERALLSLVETAEAVFAGDRNGASRRAEEAARRQKLQAAADASALRVKLADERVQARIERKKEAAKDTEKVPAKTKAKDTEKVPAKVPAKSEDKSTLGKGDGGQPDAKDPAG